jgi:YD repeat-containing protein
MTKKVFVLSLALSTILFSCDKKSDNSDEIAALQQRLDALEKGKAVTSITFDGANMILTYNTGEKVTTPIPAGIKGDKGDTGATGATGSAGKDGVGIASITYDQTTGVLKIKLTNGNESTFQIITSADGSLSAVLLSDSNGKQLISSLYAGAAPYLEMTYDPTTFDATTAKSSEIVDGQIRKTVDVTKSYTAGKLSGATVKRYATRHQVAYTTNYLGSSTQQVTSTTNKGNYYTEAGTNGLYTLYVYSYQNGANSYIYYKYTNVYKSSTTLPNYGYVKLSETTVYDLSSSAISVSGSTDYWYQVGAIYTKTGVTNPGDVVSTDTYAIETNSDGLISKASNTAEQRYVTFSYNTAKKVSQCTEYINNVAGRTMTYEYNASNQLISVKEQDGATTTEMMKAEYDANGNPIKIYTYQSELYSYGYNQFDPWSNPSDPWGGTVVRPAGMYLFATLEYTNYKNFFGNTIGSMFPGLGAYNFVNAPKRVAYANSLTFGSIEYKDFNEFGYPQTIVTNAASDEGSIRIELVASYIKKTN